MNENLFNKIPRPNNIGNSEKNEKEQLGFIEIAKVSDAEAYKDIRIEALAKNPEAFGKTFEKESKKTIDQWRAEILSENKFIVLDKINSSPTGAISIASAIKDPEKEKLFHIIEVYTREDFRRKGISERVLEKVLEEIYNRGGLRVQLGVKTGPEQEKAVELYKKLGFEIVGTTFGEKIRKLKLKNKDDYGYYIMVKDLTKLKDRI